MKSLAVHCGEVGSTLHRIGGPAVIFNDGSHVWYQEGVLHNDDGPAVCSYTPKNDDESGLLRWRMPHPMATFMWYMHGQCHRIDGPGYVIAYILDEYDNHDGKWKHLIMSANFMEEWWFNDKKVEPFEP